jgi:hypothetical protein
VGNKSDLRHLRAVPTEEAKQFASMEYTACENDSVLTLGRREQPFLYRNFSTRCKQR